MENKKIRIIAAMALTSFVLASVVYLVQQQTTVARAQEATAVSGAVSPLLQYQGRLSDPNSGQPVANGSYAMTFRLYNAASGGTALWTETKDVVVEAGLFSTLLGDKTSLSQNLFTGQALWLGIKVGADEEASPRQQMVPVAYALSLVPGASIQGNSSAAALNLANTGSGEALHADGPVNVDGDRPCLATSQADHTTMPTTSTGTHLMTTFTAACTTSATPTRKPSTLLWARTAVVPGWMPTVWMESRQMNSRLRIMSMA